MNELVVHQIYTYMRQGAAGIEKYQVAFLEIVQVYALALLVLLPDGSWNRQLVHAGEQPLRKGRAVDALF